MRLTAFVLAASLLAWQPFADAATFRLEVQSDGSGFGRTVLPTPGGAVNCDVGAFMTCREDVQAGSTVVLTAVPEAGSVFAGWSGPCSGSGTCQFTMDADKTVFATMNAAPGTNYLVVRPVSWGGVAGGCILSSPDGIDCPAKSICRANFPSQTLVTLTALPTAGTKVTWGGDCSGTGACRVSMDAQRFVVPVFEVQDLAAVNFTSLWWVPSESGWGLNLNHQGDVIFATLFTYDSSGAPLWLVAPGTLRDRNFMNIPGFFFSGDLYRATGSPFNAVPFTPSTTANLTRVGTLNLAFTGFDTARVEYRFDSRTVVKNVRKQVYAGRAADCRPTTASRASATNYQDLWWNPSESGWGINIAHQGDVLFATLFTYDATGKDLWLVMSEGRLQADGSFFGELYRTRGPAFSADPFTPVGPADVTRVGTMRLRFSDGVNGTLTYSYEGVTVIKPITRQVFSSPQPLCR